MSAPIRPTTAIRERPGPLRPGPLRVGRDPGLRLETGFLDEDERERVVAWLEAGLRPGRPGRLVREYPLLFEPGSEAVPITLWSGERPASFCFLWPTRFRLGDATLRTGLVSLVYTDPLDRGRGLARRVLDGARREARSRDLGVCLLWSDLLDFYTAQGFTRAGCESLLVVDRDVMARLRGTRPSGESGALRVEPATPADWSAIAALRATRQCHVALPDDGRSLVRIPDLDVRVARGERGVVAFAMSGRGDDFAGVIHEWAGEVEGVLRCCEALLEAAGPTAGLLLLSPEERSEVTWRLREAGAACLRNPLAFFAPTSLPALAADLAALAPRFTASIRLEGPPASDAADRPIELVERSSGARCPVSPAELMALLFSPASETDGAAVRERIAAIAPAPTLAELPLPLFVWGLESI